MPTSIRELREQRERSAHNRLRLALFEAVSRAPGLTTRGVAVRVSKHLTTHRALSVLRELERDGFVVRQRLKRALIWLPKSREQLSFPETKQ